jgi:enoyl-CoA hydratase/carnithine racemase
VSCSTLESQILTVEQRGAVVCATLNRPDALNALDADLRGALAGFWRALRDDDTARVAILTGAGRSFCSGRDRNETYGVTHGEDPQPLEPWYPGEWRLEKPVVAAIRGHCIGAGLQLALECDIRIGAEDAIFSAPQVQLGAPTRAPYVLAAAGVPRAVVMHMTLTGESLDAREALQHGLISSIATDSQLLDRAWELAGKIAEAPAPIVAGIKRAVERGLLDLPRAQAFELWDAFALPPTMGGEGP